MKENSLLFINPELARQWHPILNKNEHIEQFTIGSNKNVWWLCSKGHEWQASIKNRNHGSNCPYCSGKRACNLNCLLTTHPKIAKEFHPILNKNKTPADFTSGSHESIWWLCPKGHEYQSQIFNRKEHGCPYCSGLKACETNNLFNHPNIAKEFHPTLNEYDIKTITPNSNKNIWWICSKGHEYKATPCKRKIGRGCPYCSNRKVNGTNCLAKTHPDLAKELHPTFNDPDISRTITYGSKKMVWWVCPKGHEYKAMPNGRSSGQGCPICRESKGERAINKYLINNKLDYTRQITFNSCRNKRKMPFDFAIYHKQKTILIEYHGKQHYIPQGFGGSDPMNYPLP